MFINYKIDDYSKKFYHINNELSFLSNLQEQAEKFKNNISNIYEDIQNKNFNNKETFVISEQAGFGDTFHTKLIVQHLKKNYKNIVWITLKNIKDLYRHHSDFYIYDNGINNFLRNPASKLAQDYNLHLSIIFNNLFDTFNNKLNVSNAIIQSHIKNYLSFWEHYFYIFNIKRDFSIKHDIVHDKKNENILKKPIICFEHCSVTFANFTQLKKYQKIIDSLRHDYDIVLLGGEQDPLLNNISLDFRGKSFYDTFSVIKDSKFFIGRNSSNQLLTVFLENLPVIEVDVPDNSFIDCKYKNNVFKLFSSDDIIKTIRNLE